MLISGIGSNDTPTEQVKIHGNTMRSIKATLNIKLNATKHINGGVITTETSGTLIKESITD
jgi:hypothetical protein